MRVIFALRTYSLYIINSGDFYKKKFQVDAIFQSKIFVRAKLAQKTERLKVFPLKQLKIVMFWK